MRKLIPFALLIVFSLPVLTAQDNQKKKDPSGIWKFEALYAPEGYTSGSINVACTGKKYFSSMVFTSLPDKFTGDKVRFQNDSLFFSIFIQDQDVAVLLKMENEFKMSGKAVYSEGEVPLTVIKVGDGIKK